MRPQELLPTQALARTSIVGLLTVTTVMTVEQATRGAEEMPVCLLSQATQARIGPLEADTWRVRVSTDESLGSVSFSRAEVLRWTLPAIAARWLAPDLPALLRPVSVSPGLEGLERNALWAQYGADGAQVLVIGRWPHIALLVRPDHPPAAFERCGEAVSAVVPEGHTAWDDPPTPVREALLDIWRNLVVADTKGEPPKVARYYGLPALTARLRAVGGETWDADSLLFCDGETVGVLLKKPPGIWHDGLVADFEPAPFPPQAAPLNTGVALYEETRWYRDGVGRWVNKRADAKRGLVRIVSLGCPVLLAGEARLYALPVSPEPWPPEVWHLCKFHSLANAVLATAQRSLNLAHTVIHRAENMGAMDHSTLAEALELSTAATRCWEGVRVPPEAEGAAKALASAVRACQSACEGIAWSASEPSPLAGRTPPQSSPRPAYSAAPSISQAADALRAAEAEAGRLLERIDAHHVTRPYASW